MTIITAAEYGTLELQSKTLFKDDWNIINFRAKKHSWLKICSCAISDWARKKNSFPSSLVPLQTNKAICIHKNLFQNLHFDILSS